MDIKDIRLSEDEMKVRLRWYEKKYGPYIAKRGLHNWKNLFRKPNDYEWVITFLLIGLVFIGWAYIRDTDACREGMKNIQDDACAVCFGNTTQTTFNLTLTIKEDDIKRSGDG